MAYDRCMVTYYDTKTMEPSWMGSMIVSGENIMLRRWLLFQTKEDLLKAVIHVNTTLALVIAE